MNIVDKAKVQEKFTINPSPIRRDHIWSACQCYIWPQYPEYINELGWCNVCNTKIEYLPGVSSRGEARRAFEEIYGFKPKLRS